LFKKLLLACGIGTSLLGLETVDKPIHHDHIGTTKLSFAYSAVDYKNSLQKDRGDTYSAGIDHQNGRHHLQLLYVYNHTQTRQPPLPDDLYISKYAGRYEYTFAEGRKLNASYLYVSDNLAPTDGGNIYGLGYSYKAFNFTQYFSDYDDFDVYQSDLRIGMKKRFGKMTLFGAVIGKYIHISDTDIPFTSHARQDYFPLLLNVHLHTGAFHFNLGGIVGKRAFAVLQNGLVVQHHAMEFQYSVMAGAGYTLGRYRLHLRYARHEATEIPIQNDGVDIDVLTAQFDIAF